jgi:hypothetical protein
MKALIILLILTLAACSAQLEQPIDVEQNSVVLTWSCSGQVEQTSLQLFSGGRLYGPDDGWIAAPCAAGMMRADLPPGDYGWRSPVSRCGTGVRCPASGTFTIKPGANVVDLGSL